jgi:hypothetical protein
MHIIDRSYRKQQYLKKELENLAAQNAGPFFSIRPVVAVMAVLLLIVLSVPYFPPRYGWGTWSPPNTVTSYVTRVKEITIMVLFLILFLSLMILFTRLRNKIDLRLGFKRTGNFEIVRVVSLGSTKVLSLSNRNLFFLKSGQLHFTTVKPKQIISLNRTGTFRLLDYVIYD